MLEKSYLISGPIYPRYNKTKQRQQPQQQQQQQKQQQQQNNNNNINVIKKDKQIAIKRRKVSMKSPLLRNIQLLKSQKQLDML